ncbi:MAG: carboxypeptidase regulatory-like domain-containing protein [Planctomycetes bacterium]|nr:carboxypeptidase regulatory-like domain-containing protein [Planctomycetota bacterium]
MTAPEPTPPEPMPPRVVTTKPSRYRKSSWAIGLLVLAGLAVSLWSVLAKTQFDRGPRASVGDTVTIEQIDRRLQGGEPAVSDVPKRPVARVLEGVIRLPSGQPAGGANVAVLRATTAAPEWQAVELESTYTGGDGTFRFELPEKYGLLVEFGQPGYAGDLVEVSDLRDRIELDLLPGFELAGIVRNNLGAPVPGARVAIESPLGERRRALVRTTNLSGGFRFTNLPAGLVRLVARHERWQEVGRAVLVGELQDVDLTFTAAAAASLHGRVVTTGQVPVAGALLQLVPTNGRLGLVDPISARSDENGAFVLAGLSRGTMGLLVRHPEHGALRRAISVGATPAETVLELPPRSVVSGRLVAEPPADEVAAVALDVGGVTLRLTDTAGEIHYVTTDDDGAFAFDRPLSSGGATIRVLGAELAFAKTRARERDITVEDQLKTVLELAMTSPTVVRGRCVDNVGAPLAGVSVFGSKQFNTSRILGSTAASYLGGWLPQELALTLTPESDELLAITGTDGGVEFIGETAGPLLLRFELPDHAQRSMKFTVPPAGEVGELGDVVMRRGCRLRGVVRQGRRLVIGASVAVVGEQSQTSVVTGNGGRFEVDDLMPGEYRVRARLPSMAAGQDERTVTLVLDADAPVLQLELPRGRTFKGVVRGRERQPVANAIVVVRGAGGQPTSTDASGSFAIELPADDEVELEISTADKSHSTTRKVRAFQNDLTFQLDAPPTCTLFARVAGLPGRTRLPAVLLAIKPKASRDIGDARARLVEVQNGELRWPLCPVGPCVVEVRCEGFMPFVTEHEFAANAEHNLGEILLERGARVRGVVVDGEGRPVANARVFVGNEADLDSFEPQGLTAADGTFEIEGVSSRSSVVVAYSVGYSPTELQLSLPGDVLGDAPVEVVLERGAVIAVNARNAPPAGVVQLLRGGRLLARTVLDENGRAEFVDRGPGRYFVRLAGSRQAPQAVEVRAPGATVAVELE